MSNHINNINWHGNSANVNVCIIIKSYSKMHIDIDSEYSNKDANNSSNNSVSNIMTHKIDSSKHNIKHQQNS